MSQQLRVPLFIIFTLLIGSVALSSDQSSEISNEIPLGPDQGSRETSVILAEKTPTTIKLQLRAPSGDFRQGT